MKLLSRLGLHEIRLRPGDLRRLLVLLVVSTLCALVVLDWSQAPTQTLEVGDVAPVTVKAPYNFNYLDLAEREALEVQAAEAVAPVYVYRAELVQELRGRIQLAFATARQTLEEIPWEAADEDSTEPTLADKAALLGTAGRADCAREFRADLGVHIPDADISDLLDAGFPTRAEELATELLGRALRGYVIADRDELPEQYVPLQVIELRGQDREEVTLKDYERVITPAEARQQVSIGLLEASLRAAPWVDAAATLARASIRPNFTFDPLETKNRRDLAVSRVTIEPSTVKRGAILFRAGDVLTRVHVIKYRALQSSRTDHGLLVEFVAIALFLLLVFTALYHFGASYLGGFSTRVRDVTAVAVLLVGTAFLARTTVAVSEFIAEMLGNQAEPSSIWYVVPVAGAAMLVRLLIGVSWTVVFVVAAASVCGLVMDLEALPVVFFLLTGVVAAGTVEHTRERFAIVRAGLFTGVVAAATVLLMHFLQLYLADGVVSMSTTMRPVWSMTFAFLGGVLSVPLVLGLVPLFEGVGFVTDYRLMELANLNHPLLRQLMLRAPGSYHHSVLVGSLAEAACQSIGANVLQARVAAYFHDLGKSLKPQYFIENQRDASNRHDSLDPHTSARIIVSHVVEGGRLAKEHGLPKPIVDNVYMHHGTGLLSYFLTQAQGEAEHPGDVDEAAFRYPGPKPNTREAGIIMLADKVEAATRTIKRPTEEAFRAMILRIVNSVMADGQFEDCPLTFREIHTIVDSFVEVLKGIYHQRIEYAETAEISAGGAASTPSPSSVITLEIPTVKSTSTPTPPSPHEVTAEVALEDDHTDYEALNHLPKGE